MATLTTSTVDTSAPVRVGYRLRTTEPPGAGPAGIHARMLAGRVCTVERATPLGLRPAFAVLLGRRLEPGDPPGTVRRAFAMTFAALEFPGGFVLGDRAVDPSGGPVTVWTAPEFSAGHRPEDFGDLETRVARLAQETGGLDAGELLVATGLSGAAMFTPPGVVQVWGPGEAVLTVRFAVSVPAGQEV
ncbi:hypothetical protein [Amycolatopsis sp. H20-H5]|uniref:hypothetical protein n=1 Tax=Amycolatopsis sp. H20-H5 TaxID=3046309 RepID=UPI002DBED828|nr:hypothetical protein [Amycolatopsis sp. H20-H5]MEC3980519.1 hypothetical protein [Amycolatopsis sp. H20-H5]